MSEPHPRWQDGYAARKAGQNRDVNPHPDGSQAADHWDDGWLFADAELIRAGADPKSVRCVKQGKPRH